MMRYRRNKYAIDSIKKLREQERMATTANVDTSVTIPSKMLLAVSARPMMGNTRGRQLAIASKKIRKEEMAATRKSTNVAAPVGDVHVDAGVSARLNALENTIISLVSKRDQENEAAESKNRVMVDTIKKLEAQQSLNSQAVKNIQLKFDCFASKQDLEKEVAESKNRALVDTIEKLEAQKSLNSQDVKDIQLKFDCFASKQDLEKEVAESKNRALVDTIEKLEAQKSEDRKEIKDMQMKLDCFVLDHDKTNQETAKLSLSIRSTSMIEENDTIISTDNDQKQMSPINKEKNIYSFRDDYAPNNTSTTCHSPVDISIKNEVWNETDVRVNQADIVRSTTAVSSSEVDYSTIYSPFNGTKLCNWGSSDTSTAEKTNPFEMNRNDDPWNTMSVVSTPGVLAAASISSSSVTTSTTSTSTTTKTPPPAVSRYTICEDSNLKEKSCHINADNNDLAKPKDPPAEVKSNKINIVNKDVKLSKHKMVGNGHFIERKLSKLEIEKFYGLIGLSSSTPISDEEFTEAYIEVRRLLRLEYPEVKLNDTEEGRQYNKSIRMKAMRRYKLAGLDQAYRNLQKVRASLVASSPINNVDVASTCNHVDVNTTETKKI